MYQAYVVQRFGENEYNVILGRSFETIDAAVRAVNLYEDAMGKCERGVIEPAGREIPTASAPEKSLKDKIFEFLGGIR